MILGLILATQIAVIAHRAEHIHHAENSVPAIESAIALGADYVELDVRTTSDGKLVLMHDNTVDRTTNGHGRVKEMTLEEIRKVEFKEFGGHVPTFEEALDTAHGRVRVYLDWKDAKPELIYKALSEHKMLDQVVVYGGVGELHKLQELAPGIHVMPEADGKGAVRHSSEALHEDVIAFDEDDFKPEVIEAAKALKADIYVDRLGDQDTPEYWQKAIDAGATGIQTNHPEELVKFLREKKLHP